MTVQGEGRGGPYFVPIAVGLVLLLVAATCWPVIAYPQLDPDDYRYLSLLDTGRDSVAGLFERTVVENRWDHLWWLAPRDPVRFWRPTVLASFWLDRAIWGRDAVVFGLCLSNVLIHAACCLLVLSILIALLGRRLETLAGVLLFAAFFAHGETIWYVSGRTDTIAVFFFLLAFRLHLLGGRWRHAGALAFFFAVLTKELTIALPVLLWVLRPIRAGEPFSVRRELRASWRWLAAYAAVVLAWYGLRLVALDGRPAGGASHPYFISPFGGDFLAHVWTQLRAYAENLVFAYGTPPFLEAHEMADYGFAPWRTAVAGAIALVVLLVLRRDRWTWFFVLFAVLTWLPTSFVYVSERYLLLPSVGVAGVTVRLLQRLPPVWPRVLGHAVVLVWIVHQAVLLQQKNWALMQTPREPEAFERILEESGFVPPRGGTIYFVNFPSNWIHAQFFEAQLCVHFGDPELRVRILSTALNGGRIGRTPLVHREDGSTLLLRSDGSLTAVPPRLRQFDFVSMEPGRRVERPALGFGVSVLAGNELYASDARYEFERPLAAAEIWSFVPGREPPASPFLFGTHVRQGHLVKQ